MSYQSIKVYDGYSCCFRQWKAEDTHCKFLHGYGISFEITFEGELDNRNWVMDFGIAKRSNTLIEGMSPKEWMDYMFDHTVIIAEDDPYIDTFRSLYINKIIQLREVKTVGAERFAQFTYSKLQDWVHSETNGRVRIIQIKFMEHGKNSAIYKPNDKN